MDRRDRIQLYHLIGCFAFMATVVAGCVCRADDDLVAVSQAQARARLALVTTETPVEYPPNTGSAYGDAVESSRRNGFPLVVYVGGVKARSFQRANTLQTPTFDGVKGSGVVVGVWHSGDFIRIDLPANATDKEISSALYSAPPPGYKCVSPVVENPPTNAQAIQNYLSRPRNVGRCECGATGKGCHCNPAWTCGREPCTLHNPLLNPSIVAPVPQLKFALPQDCPTGQ